MTRIAIDFDETLFPTLENVIKIYNERYNDTLSLDQIITYNLYECLPAQVTDKLLELYVDQVVYDSLQPYDGAIKAIQTLMNNENEIFIATATDVRNLEWKEQLLRRYFPFIPKENLIRIHNKKLLNVDILIEDNLYTLTQTSADRVCFDQPWNRSDSKDFVYNINRAYCWGDIINIIDKIKKENEEWEKNNR